MNLVIIEKSLKHNAEESERLKRAYELAVKNNAEEGKELRRLKEVIMGGYDIEKIVVAEGILNFYNGFDRYHAPTVLKVKEDIATGTDLLRKEYFGIKDYAHWTGQDITCSYGMGPRHGSVVFRVGLKVRDRELTDTERDACLYYLNLLGDKNFRAKAKVH